MALHISLVMDYRADDLYRVRAKDNRVGAADIDRVGPLNHDGSVQLLLMHNGRGETRTNLAGLDQMVYLVPTLA
jgi:hypothetical protein